jgi:hypothetical protein
VLHQYGVHPELAKRKGLERADFFALQRLLRQYLYVCTSEASKLSTQILTHTHSSARLSSACSSSGVSICTLVPVKQQVN